MKERTIIKVIQVGIQLFKQNFIFKYFCITIISVIAFHFILLKLDKVNKRYFKYTKEKFDKAKKANDYNRSSETNTIENINSLKKPVYAVFESDEYLEFKDRFVDEYGDFLPCFSSKLYYRSALYKILGLIIFGITGYVIFLIINNRIIEAKTIFTILITLSIFYIFIKGIDKGYKNDNCIIQNSWKTESIFKMLNDKNWKEKNKYQIAEKFLEKIKIESTEKHKESYDYLKWWLPQIITWLGSVYFIWFGGK